MNSQKPWFKSYWSDYQIKDLALCSLAARGLWLVMYEIFNREPVGVLQLGQQIVTPHDLYYDARPRGKDFPKVDHGSGLEVDVEADLEVSPEACRALFDSLFEELREAELIELAEDGRIVCPWMKERHEINEKRAAGGRRGGNPKLRRKASKGTHGAPSRKSTEGAPLEVRTQKSPTDSAQHPQRQRLERVLKVFEDHGRRRPKGPSIGALARRLKLYAESRDGDLDAGCDALVADLRDFGRRGKLLSSRYVLSLLDGQLEQERIGQGLEVGGQGRHGGRPADAGAHPETLAEAEALD